MKDHDLARRHAFWRNLEFSMENFIKDFEARKADKWIDDEDIRRMTEIQESLEQGLLVTRKRYYAVLAEVITEQENEGDCR